jgi:hypothetical protein
VNPLKKTERQTPLKWSENLVFSYFDFRLFILIHDKHPLNRVEILFLAILTLGFLF